MRPQAWLLVTRVLVCAALGLSSALYVHYLNPADSDFCGLHSGCEAVRKSGLAYFFGSRFLSLPLVSLVAYAAVLGLSLRRLPAPGAPREAGLHGLWRAPELSLFAATGLGAAIAISLVAYQAFGLGAFCWLCLSVDATAVLAAVAAFLWSRALAGASEVPRRRVPAGSWLAGAALLVAGPLVWSAIRPAPPIPAQIAALYQPGKINVVEFADFECPYCRRLHGVLGPLVREYGDRAAFQRLQRPLAQHPHSDPAARAALCAAAQGKGEEMADRLFTMTLSDEAIQHAAEALRLDPGRYDACLNSPETDAILVRDAALLPDDQFEGLPTTYVGGTRILGVATETTLRDAFERALRPARLSLSGPVYVALLAVSLYLVFFVGARRASKHA
jgi:uncharacterized membrane protein/predicted DsbA family dithiol-disulfide isomerase